MLLQPYFLVALQPHCQHVYDNYIMKLLCNFIIYKKINLSCIYCTCLWRLNVTNDLYLHYSQYCLFQYKHIIYVGQVYFLQLLYSYVNGIFFISYTLVKDVIRTCFIVTWLAFIIKLIQTLLLWNIQNIFKYWTARKNHKLMCLNGSIITHQSYFTKIILRLKLLPICLNISLQKYIPPYVTLAKPPFMKSSYMHFTVLLSSKVPPTNRTVPTTPS